MPPCRMAWHDSGTYDQVRCCLHCPPCWHGHSAVGRGLRLHCAAELLSAMVQSLLLGAECTSAAALKPVALCEHLVPWGRLGSHSCGHNPLHPLFTPAVHQGVP